MLVGSPSVDDLQAAIDCAGPVLLVVPAETSLDGLGTQWPERVTACVELLGADPGEVCWYHYNDSRYHGLQSPEELQPQRPNLRLQSLELRPVRTLAQVCERWAESEGAVHEGAGLLWLLEPNNAATTLAGAGAWLNALETIHVAGTLPEPAQLTALLDGACFRPTASEPSLHQWQRDPLRVLQNTCDALIAERDGVLAQNHDLTQQHHALQQSQAQLSAERDSLIAERDALRAAHDELGKTVAAREDQFQRINQELDEILRLIDSTEPSPPAPPDSEQAAETA